MLTDYTLTARQRLLLFCKEQQPSGAVSPYAVEVYRPHGSPAINYVLDELSIPYVHVYEYDDLKDNGFRLDDAVIVRSRDDINPTIAYDGQGYWYAQLPDQNTTFIVIGDIDLQNTAIMPCNAIDGQYTRRLYRFVGVAEASLTCNLQPVFIDTPTKVGNFIVDGVDIINNGGNAVASYKHSIRTEYSGWNIRNAKLTGNVKLDDQSGYVRSVTHKLRNVEIDMRGDYMVSNNVIRTKGHLSLTDIKIRNHAGGIANVIDMGAADDAATIAIDGLSVEYLTEPTAAVFLIGSTGHSYHGAISVKNLNFFRGVNTVVGRVPMCLFATEVNPIHLYHNDSRIIVDTCRGWGQYLNNNVAVVTQASKLIPTQLSSFIGNRFAQYSDATIGLNGGEDALYRVNIRARALTTNVATTFNVYVQPGLRPISNKQKVYTDNGSLYANINTSFMVHMLAGERLSMYVENLFDSSDITLSDLDVQITQV